MKKKNLLNFLKLHKRKVFSFLFVALFLFPVFSVFSFAEEYNARNFFYGCVSYDWEGYSIFDETDFYSHQALDPSLQPSYPDGYSVYYDITLPDDAFTSARTKGVVFNIACSPIYIRQGQVYSFVFRPVGHTGPRYLAYQPLYSSGAYGVTIDLIYTNISTGQTDFIFSGHYLSDGERWEISGINQNDFDMQIIGLRVSCSVDLSSYPNGQNVSHASLRLNNLIVLVSGSGSSSGPGSGESGNDPIVFPDYAGDITDYLNNTSVDPITPDTSSLDDYAGQEADLSSSIDSQLSNVTDTLGGASLISSFARPFQFFAEIINYLFMNGTWQLSNPYGLGQSFSEPALLRTMFSLLVSIALSASIFGLIGAIVRRSKK